MKKSKTKKHESPLTMEMTENNDEEVVDDAATKKKQKRKEQKSRKRARREAQEDLEEEGLTRMIFGGNAAMSGDAAWNDEDDDDEDNEEDVSLEKQPSHHQEEEFSFQIDRSGAVDEKSKRKDLESDENSSEEEDAASEDVGDDDEDSKQMIEGDAPAWVDDEEEAHVSLVESGARLRKLRHSRQETKALTADELEQRLRKRYEESTQRSARTDWATTKPSKKDSDDEDNEAAKLFSTSGSLLASSRSRLPPNILKIVRCPDANQSDYSKAVVRAVHFHPGSDPDRPLLLTAGLDKSLRFFQVGADKSEKIHGIHFPKMPIYSANFLGNTGNVVVTGRRPFFYIYNAVAGKVDLIPRINGRDERSWERHVVSPDGKLIAFMGNDGYIVLVDSHSKHWVGDMKCNGSVRALSFSPDGKYILASGSDGDVYRWDVHSRRCIERFSNNDGTITASLAATSKHLAVGAESGVVNLYSEHKMSSSKTPLKSIMNLHTSAEDLRFNQDGQILAMLTKREQHGLKLLHVPSKTVFSNWPTSKTPLKHVWSMDFSPESKFFCVGNDKGKCLLYQLGHYQD